MMVKGKRWYCALASENPDALEEIADAKTKQVLKECIGKTITDVFFDVEYGRVTNIELMFGEKDSIHLLINIQDEDLNDISEDAWFLVE